MTLGLCSGGPLVEQLRTVVKSVKIKPLTAKGSPGEVRAEHPGKTERGPKGPFPRGGTPDEIGAKS